MGQLAGWFGKTDNGADALVAMLGAMNALRPATEELIGEGFALGTMQPGLAGDISRIATSDDGKVAVGFAGYLHDEDSEVTSGPAQHCLELYEQEGARFASRLNGTFAVAVLDGRAGRVHLVADRLASRPVYYSEGSPFAFGTNIDAVLALPGLRADLNPERVIEFLALGQVPATATFCDQINLVPCGSMLTWDGERSHVEAYWSPQYTWEEEASLDECADRIAGALRGAVERICARAGNPVLMLSGGLDSRATAAASPKPLHCVTMHWSDRAYEVVAARKVARALGHTHEFVPMPEDHPMGLLELGTALNAGGKSFNHSQAIYLADRMAELEPEAILNGWGLDGFFRGGCLPLVPRTGLWRLAPPRLKHPDKVGSSVDHLVSVGTTVPREVLCRLCYREPSEFLAEARVRLGESEARLAEGARSPHDVPEAILLPNLATVVPLADMPAVDYITAAESAAFDNEVIDAYLRTPPTLRHRHIAYSRAIAKLSPEVARLPYTATGVPVSAGPLLEYCMGTPIRCWRAGARYLRRRFSRAPDLTGSWPDIAQTMARRPAWQLSLIHI